MIEDTSQNAVNEMRALIWQQANWFRTWVSECDSTLCEYVRFKIKHRSKRID